MFHKNENIVDLYIKLEFLNSKYINLEFNDYLKKNVIHIAYNSPSFFLSGIFLKYITNNVKIMDTIQCERDDIDDYMNNICNSKCDDSNNLDNISNLDSIIDQKSEYKHNNKNKTLKNIKFSFDKHYIIQLVLNVKDECDYVLIEKLLDCNQKLYNTIKHNVNFSRKNLKNKTASPKNSSSDIDDVIDDESMNKIILPPTGINKRTLYTKSNMQTVLFNDIIKRVNKDEYCIELFCDYKTYICIQSRLYDEKINYGTLESKDIEFSISKIILDSNNEIVPLIELINYN